MNKGTITVIAKKTLLTLAFPAFMFVVMLGITGAAGVGNLFLSGTMLSEVAFGACLTTVIALSIFLQFKNGRFDFSGGATMVLTGILAGNIAKMLGGNPVLFLLISIAIATVLSFITAGAYCLSRVPIIICTIGITLIFESLTYLFFDGEGVNIITDRLSLFGRVPYVFILFALALAVYIVYTYFTVEGRRGKLLAGNQKVTVNVGVRESRNVFATYLVSGILLGIAAVIYVSRSKVGPQANLATSSILFSYIVPVFIGMFLGKASIDAIGIVVASIGMQFLNYGLNCLGVGSGGWQNIIFGVFMLAFYAFSGQFDQLKKVIMSRHLPKKQAEK